MNSNRSYNPGRGRGAAGSGRGRGGGERGNYQDRGGRGGGGGGGRVNYWDQGGRGRGNYQNQPSHSGGRGWSATPRGSQHQSPSQQQSVSRPPVQSNQPAPPAAWGYRPPQTSSSPQPQQVGVGPASGRSARPWVQSSSTSPAKAPPRTQWAPSSSSPPPQAAPQPSASKSCFILVVVFTVAIISHRLLSLLHKNDTRLDFFLQTETMGAKLVIAPGNCGGYDSCAPKEI